MQAYNVILLCDKNVECLLFCKRKKEPYKGKRNLIDGKIEYGRNREIQNIYQRSTRGV